MVFTTPKNRAEKLLGNKRRQSRALQDRSKNLAKHQNDKLKYINEFLTSKTISEINTNIKQIQSYLSG